MNEIFDGKKFAELTENVAAEGEKFSNLLDQIMNVSNRSDTLPNVILAQITGIGELGNPLIEYSLQGHRFKLTSALSNVEIDATHVGRQCSISFVNNNKSRPIILGLIQSTGESTTQKTSDDEPTVKMTENTIELKIGEASLCLYKNGTVEINGKYVISKSYGANVIKGASIKLN